MRVRSVLEVRHTGDWKLLHGALYDLAATAATWADRVEADSRPPKKRMPDRSRLEARPPRKGMV